MNKIIILIALVIFSSSCSNKKKDINEQILKITNEVDVMVKEDRETTEQKRKEIESLGKFIIDMAKAGAPKKQIDSLQKVSDEMQANFLKHQDSILFKIKRSNQLIDSLNKTLK